MNEYIEISLAVQNKNRSLIFNISRDVDGNLASASKELCDCIIEAEGRLLNDNVLEAPEEHRSIQDVKVFDVPQKNEASAKPHSTKQTKKAPLSAAITSSQADTIHRVLTEKNIPVSDFCRLHGISAIEDLTKNEAWHIINEKAYR